MLIIAILVPLLVIGSTLIAAGIFSDDVSLIGLGGVLLVIAALFSQNSSIESSDRPAEAAQETSDADIITYTGKKVIIYSGSNCNINVKVEN